MTRWPHRHVESARLAGAAVELVCSRCGRSRLVPLVGPRSPLPEGVLMVDAGVWADMAASLAIENAFAERWPRD